MGSILTGGSKILLLNFLFTCGKASDANVGIIANFVSYGKTRMQWARWESVTFQQL